MLRKRPHNKYSGDFDKSFPLDQFLYSSKYYFQQFWQTSMSHKGINSI